MEECENERSLSVVKSRHLCVQPIEVHTVIHNVNTYNRPSSSGTRSSGYSRRVQETSFNDISQSVPDVGKVGQICQLLHNVYLLYDVNMTSPY